MKNLFRFIKSAILGAGVVARRGANPIITLEGEVEDDRDHLYEIPVFPLEEESNDGQ